MILTVTLIGILLVVADQLIKIWAYNVLAAVGTISVIPGVFSLTYVENPGAAWGIFKGATWYLIAMPIVVIALIVGYLIRKKIKNGWMLWSAMLIIAGGVGNLIDRINVFGRTPLTAINSDKFVIDYLQVKFFNFPVFNLADCCITIGGVLLVLYILIDDFRARKQSHDE